MKKIKIKFFCTAIFFTLLICFAFVEAKASERKQILQSCVQIFGELVDEKQTLFEVNHFYVLQLTFNETDNLKQLYIKPKYYFEETHPNWEETDKFEYLSKIEFKNLLAKLDTIKFKGALIESASQISVVTNMTAHRTEKYQNAFLTWGEVVDLSLPENTPLKIRWFKIDFGKPNDEMNFPKSNDEIKFPNLDLKQVKKSSDLL